MKENKNEWLSPIIPKDEISTWQRYYSSGIAVSTKTGEVIYWATGP